MAEGTYRAPRRTFSTVSVVLALVMMMVVMAFAPAVGADVPRYQFTTDEYDLVIAYRPVLDAPEPAVLFFHLTVSLDNPCTGEYSGTVYFLGDGKAATITSWEQTATDLTFWGNAIWNEVFSLTFVATGDGVTWIGEYEDADGKADTTLTWTDHSSTSYKNHGDWVASDVSGHGNPDNAMSCIGMPIVSNKNK